ncbi:flavin-containing monooxygenase [Streptomyces jumonjinensis]|uniref:flavin-containing monooxygenase n=1 Tax=Streptomyces jumonjinensis TaxID=1945 RepID=UPI003788FD56
MDTAIVIGGGQGGLGAAYALRNQGFRPVILEAGAEPVGSWPRYYDSLIVFTPLRFFALPGMPPAGDPRHFPSRDEVVAYLRRYAAHLDCEIRTGQRVSSVVADRDGYTVATEDGSLFHGSVVVAATGTFANPHRPELPGLAGYTGKVLHSAEYRSPAPFDGQRVVVVGSANSAVQIAYELADRARTTLASRRPVRFTRSRLYPGDGAPVWKLLEAIGRLPVGPLLPPHGSSFNVVPDYDGKYRTAIEEGRPDRREMFTGADGTELRWADGRSEHVDTVVLATGYRPALEYLRPLGALDRRGTPRQRHGLSTSHPGLAFMGLEGQHTILSTALHGVGADAEHVARTLRRQVARSTPALLARPRARALTEVTV